MLDAGRGRDRDATDATWVDEFKAGLGTISLDFCEFIGFFLGL
jgi:hypothetical protein